MKNKRYLFFSLVCLLLLKSCASIAEYPETRKVSQIDLLHGIEVEDPYRWLEDFTSEEVGAWVGLQNDLSQKYLTKNQYRKRIKENLESIWVSNSKSIPQIRGGHIFYFFNEGSWQQSKLMKQECDTCLPEVTIDPNTFSVDGTVSLSNLSISPNGKFIAYSISDGGSDWKTWKVLDVETNRVLEDSIKWTKFSSGNWESDNSGFYYQKYPEPKEVALSDINRRKRIAAETMEIYAPLSERMGMNYIRDELEDLSFQELNPEARNLIVERLSLNKKDREKTFKEISKTFEKVLTEKKVNTKIKGREKTPFSIWRKMQSRRISLEQLTDIVGFRVIVDNIKTCYEVLGIFHSMWSMIPGRFKDYISTPKINNYKSLHTAVIGPNKEIIEIQIRTQQMHDFAERGIASHWKYKSSEKLSHLALKEYDWLRDLVEIIEKDTSPEHFLEYTKLQMFEDNVFCFTPKGEVIKLPKDATPIDFAYAVHTKVGDSVVACEINGRGSPLQSILKNGDLVKIIGSNNVSPSLQWLSYAKTGKARAAIRRYWHNKTNTSQIADKKYVSSLCIQIPNVPGKLGEVSSLIGFHQNNIINMEIVEKKADHLEFIFDIQIKDLKNYRNLISELKLKEYKLKIIRHRKKDAFLQRIFKNFKRN